MSIKAINWALALPLSSTQKLVLLVLANCANENNFAFPSTAYLVRTTGLTDRAIRSARKALRELGLLTPLPTRGRTPMRLNTVRLNLEEGLENELQTDPQPSALGKSAEGKMETPARPSSRNPLPPTRNVLPPKRNQLPPLREPSRTQKEPSPQPPKAPSPETIPQKLPPNWQPTPELRAFAQAQGCDPLTLAAAFCAYWHAATGPKALKSDWNQAWKAWCRRQKFLPRRAYRHADHPPPLGLQTLDRLAAAPTGNPSQGNTA